jgi:hypothetical protein
MPLYAFMLPIGMTLDTHPGLSVWVTAHSRRVTGGKVTPSGLNATARNASTVSTHHAIITHYWSQHHITSHTPVLVVSAFLLHAIAQLPHVSAKHLLR